jgi:SpoVK/Ycf46/Vps4 family AAA+-type ATPase
LLTCFVKKYGDEDLATYDELLDYIAIKCEGFSGASLAGVVRAGASRALERAVCDFAGALESEASEGTSIADCLVTKTDFELAIEDVVESSTEGDGGEEEDTGKGKDEDTEKENNDKS